MNANKPLPAYLQFILAWALMITIAALAAVILSHALPEMKEPPSCVI